MACNVLDQYSEGLGPQVPRKTAYTAINNRVQAKCRHNQTPIDVYSQVSYHDIDATMSQAERDFSSIPFSHRRLAFEYGRFYVEQILLLRLNQDSMRAV